MRIPRVPLTVGAGPRTLDVEGEVDTGNEGLASVKPGLASRLGLRTVRMGRILTAGGARDVPVARLSLLGVRGSPECFLPDVEVLVHDFPSAGEVLLGERFFERFQFDIGYRDGDAVVLCAGKRVDIPRSTWWTIPAGILAGLAVVVVAVHLSRD